MMGIGALLLATASVGAGGDDAVLVHFSATWCGPCREAAPIVQRLERDGYAVRHVDIDREPHIASRYGIKGVPAFVVLKGGREAARFSGPQSHDVLARAMSDEDRGEGITNTGATAQGRGLPPGGEKPKSDAPLGASGAIARAEAATVRLRVDDGGGQGVGTGTIIDVHGEEALVLTCGHVFRDSQGKGEVEVDLFVGGETRTVAGQLVDYDADKRDIALVAIRPGVSVVPVPVAGPQDAPQAGQSAFSLGCDRGADPSRRDTRITAVDKYVGPPNVEIAGAPVQGRSGGGLFDSRGRLIGVCNAADPQDDIGIYAGPGVIHWQLDRLDLAHVYQGDGDGDAPVQLASDRSRSEPAPGGGDRREGPATELQPLGGGPSAPNAAIAAAGASEASEVICIVRDRNNPDAAPRVVTFDRPPQELMELLGN